MPSEQEIAAGAKALEANLSGVLPWRSFGFALVARLVLEEAERVRSATAKKPRLIPVDHGSAGPPILVEAEGSS